MVVYADILIITNFIVDYFLLGITGRIIKRSPPLLRRLIAAFFAACGALIIFLPEQNALLQISFRLVFCYIICVINFSFEGLKKTVFTALMFFAVTACFAGIMFALWYIFKPSGMVINNSAVYFDISPAFLICFSALGFIIFSAISHLLSRRSKTAENCLVTLTFGGKPASFKGIVDNGNSLTDSFTQKAVIITDGKKASLFFGALSPDIYAEKYRAIPCGTVSGHTILDGYRCESGVITLNGRTFKLDKPIMAISKTPLCDCEAIVNPLDCI